MTSQYQDKIVDEPALTDLVARARENDQRIVLCHGCFDIVHPGHIRHLQHASKQGDLLIVSITGDQAIHKDTDRPYIPQELRAENLAALEFVDVVYVDSHHTAVDVLKQVKPDIYVKGEEYQRAQDPRFLEEQHTVENYGGRVIFSSGDIVFSSSELIRSLGRDYEIESKRLTYICQRHNINRSSLSDVISQFSNQRVLVIGDVVIDRYVFCDTIDIARESPMMAMKRLEESTFVGGAGVVAMHLSRLGAQVQLATCLGSQGPSEKALRRLDAEGIETHSLITRDRLVIKTRYLVEDNKLFKVEESETCPLDTQAIKRASSLITAVGRDVDAVVFCDFGYGTVSERLLAAIQPALRESVDVITADVSGPRSTLMNYANIDLFCPTEREIRATLHNFDDGLSGVAWDLMNETQVKHIIATLGRKGLVVFERQSNDPSSPDWRGRLRSEYMHAFNDRAVDALGCGDALLAGCTLGLACGASLYQAAYIGNLLAAIEAGQIGNRPVDSDQLQRAIELRSELQLGKDHKVIS